MLRRKLLIAALAVGLLSAGIVAAQSSASFVVQRTVLLSGGGAASTNYRVNAVIGQPAAGWSESASQDVSAGYLFPFGLSYRLWLPQVHR